MKNVVTTAAAAVFALMGSAAGPASAAIVSGFSGAYAGATWSRTIGGTLPGGTDGSATFAPTTLTLVGGDDPTMTGCVGAITGLPGMCQLSTTHGKVGASDTYSFAWRYTTTDITTQNDLFGVLVDGLRTVLADPGGPLTQSGTFTVSPTSTFGFFINCTDCVGGAGTATISGFQVAVVPEPATLALFGVGVAAVGAARRRRAARPPAA